MMARENDLKPSTFVELRAGMARAGIQAALLLNGGAAVVLLNLIGNIASAPTDRALAVELALVKWSLATFALGVFLAAATYAVAFMALHAFVENAESETGHRLRRMGLRLIGGSLFAFLFGVILAAMSVSSG